LTRKAKGAPPVGSIQCWYEFASTYSYLAICTAEEEAKEAGLSIEWQPFLLGPVFASMGWRDSPFNLYAAKGAYMWRDMERLCRRANLDFNRPTEFPRNGLLPARIAARFASSPWVMTFVRGVYDANFVLDRDIADRSVISEILQRCGADAGEVLKESESPASKLLMRQQTDQAARLGVFGAPTFVVEGELFWGGDRLSHAIEWALGDRSARANFGKRL
jgi:2-hydroxychromene-2-carboxylate isomerase